MDTADLLSHLIIHVRQIRVAYRGAGIPFEHGIDRLAELGTALLVDAASVYTHPVTGILLCNVTSHHDLLLPWGVELAPILERLKRDLLVLGTPSVGQDRIRWDLTVEELLELKGAGVDETHG